VRSSGKAGDRVVSFVDRFFSDEECLAEMSRINYQLSIQFLHRVYYDHTVHFSFLKSSFLLFFNVLQYNIYCTTTVRTLLRYHTR
jgi:hypothetical protein